MRIYNVAERGPVCPAQVIEISGVKGPDGGAAPTDRGILNGLARCYGETCQHLFDPRHSRNEVLCPCCARGGVR